VRGRLVVRMGGGFGARIQRSCKGRVQSPICAASTRRRVKAGTFSTLDELLSGKT